MIAMSGKAIEIINTDAEGRLVLADGLHLRQAAWRYPPDRRRHPHRSLRRRPGHHQRRHLLQRRRLLRALHHSLTTSGEKIWRLPLEDEYKEQIRSHIGDIMNTGGRWGGASHRSHVPERIRRGDALDSPRYRGRCLDGRAEALDRQGPFRNRGPQHRGMGSHLLEVAATSQKGRIRDGCALFCHLQQPSSRLSILG